MRNKLLIYLLVSAMAVLCISCTRKGAATEKETAKTQVTDLRFTEATSSADSVHENALKTGAAEALRSAMKGTRDVFELTKDERLFDLGGFSDTRYAAEVKDMPDTGLTKVNVLEYGRNYKLSLTDGVEWQCFLCVDLDQDGTKEVLLVGKGGKGVRAILHYAGNEVYFTAMPSAMFPSEVYENGVCTNKEWSVWSLCHDAYYPARGAMYVDMLAYSDEGRYEEISSDIYEIDNKRVTKDEYYAYINDLTGGLTPLEWYDFTEENIDRYVID